MHSVMWNASDNVEDGTLVKSIGSPEVILLITGKSSKLDIMTSLCAQCEFTLQELKGTLHSK